MSDGQQARPVLSVAMGNAGVRKGMRGAQYLIEWALCAADGVSFDGTITEQVREYCEWWRVPERTAWRHLDEFRQAFPGETTPARLAEQIAPQFHELVERLATLSNARRTSALASSMGACLSVALPV